MNGRTNPVALIAAALLLWVSGVRADDGISVEAIRVPDGGTYPQARTDSAGRIHLTYVTGDPMRGDLFYVRSDDGGKTFSQPLRVNSQPQSVVFMGTVRGPQIAVGRGDRVHVAWMGSDKATVVLNGKKATPMLYARMNDAGDAFEPQRNVIRQHPGLDGGGSVAADREGNVYVAWHAPGGGEGEGHGGEGKGHAGGHGGGGGGAGEENRTVWVARSRDDGQTFDPETAALPEKTGVCGCCGMRIDAGEKGNVSIVYRSAHETVNRDIHLLTSEDYGKTFKVAAVDPWKIGACVMSTASIAEAPGGRLIAAWEAREQIDVINLDRGSNDAATRPTAVPGPAGGRKHPSVAANARGEYVVAWAAGTGWNKGGSVAWQGFDRDGRPVPTQAGRMDGLPVWGVPAVVALPDGHFKVFF